MTDSDLDPRVSVVICTYATDMFDHFTDAADSVLEQSYDDLELVVFIDGNDDLCDLVRERYGDEQDVVIHCNADNRGLSFGRNTGIELATGHIVAFMDDDAVADEEWVAELVATYRRHDAQAVGGRMVPAWLAGEASYLPEEFYWLIGVTYRGFPTVETEVRNTFSSNLSFRRDVIQDLGGFRTDMGKQGRNNLQGAETELCARLRQSFGASVIYNPDAIVAHKVFEYRTDPLWLVRRAFWQGYSKRVMQNETPEAIDTELGYLSQLLSSYLPHRIVGLLKGPSLEKASQLCALVILLSAVGIGYLAAIPSRFL